MAEVKDVRRLVGSQFEEAFPPATHPTAHLIVIVTEGADRHVWSTLTVSPDFMRRVLMETAQTCGTPIRKEVLV